MASVHNRYRIILCVLIAGALSLSCSKVSFKHQLSWDAFGYYLYLPALFIYDDPDLSESWVDDTYEKYYVSDTQYQLNTQPDGSRVIKYPAGLAILYTPGFIAGHLYALSNEKHAADGFSPPYAIAVTLWCLLLISAGVFLFFEFLRRLSNSHAAFITTLALLAGTNFLATAYLTPVMPHGLLFLLYVLLLFFTAKAVDANSFRHAAMAAFVFGLIALSRASEIVALVIPLTYGLASGKGLLSRDGMLRKQGALRRWLVLAAIILVMGGIQLVYWKLTAGELIYNSYDNPGEGLDLWSPHLRESLFSFRKGWWLYTPMALLAFVGIFHPALSRRGWRIPLLLFMTLTIWLVSSWTTWWFADSFGQRAYVQSYAVLFMGLAVLIESAQRGQRLLQWAGGSVLVLFIALNLFQTWQFTEGVLPTDRITQAYYNEVFLRTSKPEEAGRLLSVNRQQNGAGAWGRRASYRTTLDTNVVISSPPGVEVSEFPYTWSFKSSDRFSDDHAFVVLDWEVQAVAPQEGRFQLVTCAFYKGGAYNWRSNAFNLTEASGSAHFVTPHFRSADDEYRIQLWNPQLTTIDSLRLRIRVLEP